MAFRKCPKCEINYITDSETICSVCRRDASGETEQYDVIEICSECGENPVVPGKELCAECLKELQRRSQEPQEDAIARTSTVGVGIDSVSTMDEIELDIPDDLDDDFSEDKDTDDEDDTEEDDFNN